MQSRVIDSDSMSRLAVLTIAVTMGGGSEFLVGCSRSPSSSVLSPDQITAHISDSSVIGPFSHVSSSADLVARAQAVSARDYTAAISLYKKVAGQADPTAEGQAETRIA
jgi:hypothetical protein